MKFGLFDLNKDVCSYAGAAVQVAQAAEAAGFESLWVSEHIALPDPPIPRFPVEPETRWIEPLTMLTFLAGQTARIKLGTGVVILPQRNPLILAKQLASMDELSDGRLLFGLGVGHLQPEMEAIGVPFNRRGAMGDEYLAAMHALWHQPQPAYQGRYVSFSQVQSHPQRDVHLVIGGHSPAAHRRAIKHGRGWYGYSLDLEATEQALTGLRAEAQAVDRPAELGQLEISISPPRGMVEPEQVAQYAALGVARLILLPPLVASVDERLKFIDEVHDRLIKA